MEFVRSDEIEAIRKQIDHPVIDGDVPDFRSVLPEAWELIEKDLLDRDQFEAFMFGNAASFVTGANPDYFEGTVVAEAVAGIERG